MVWGGLKNDWRGLARRAGVRWSMLDWMDGDRRGGRQRQLQRRPGQRRQQRLAVAGWAASAAGVEWAWSRLRGRWVWMRSGGVQSESRSGRWGVSREGGGSQGQRRREVQVRVAKEGSGRDARGVQVGAGGERGSRFIWQTGCCENAGATATATATARATGQDGDRQRQHPRRGRHRRLLRHGQQRRPRRRGPGQRRRRQ